MEHIQRFSFPENLLHVASVCLNLFQDVAYHSFRTNTAPLQLQPNAIVELNCKGSCTASWLRVERIPSLNLETLTTISRGIAEGPLKGWRVKAWVFVFQWLVWSVGLLHHSTEGQEKGMRKLLFFPHYKCNQTLFHAFNSLVHMCHIKTPHTFKKTHKQMCTHTNSQCLRGVAALNWAGLNTI